MQYLRGSSSPAVPMARGKDRRVRPSTPSFSALVLFLVVALTPTDTFAQFQLWGEFPVENPFSVTAAVRGLQASPGPGDGPPPIAQVRLEAIAGYFSTTTFQNQFDYHGSIALDAPAPDSPVHRILNTRNPITFTDSGRQSAFDGLCCSNKGLGFDHNRSVYVMTDFNSMPATAYEVVIDQPEGVVPRFGSRPSKAMSTSSRRGDPCDDLDISVIECAFSTFDDWLIDEGFPTEGQHDIPDHILEECYDVAADEAGGTAGLKYNQFLSEFFDGAPVPGSAAQGPPPPTQFIERASIPDCVSPFTNWHFTATGSGELREVYVACVSVPSFNFVIKRISIDNYAVTEIPLASNIPIPAPKGVFAYTHSAACAIDDGVVIGSVLPRADLANTTFFATKLNTAGVVQGTSSIVLPGARGNKQAFFCRRHGNFATFVYHGMGANPGETDTFVIQAGDSFAPRTDEGVGDPLGVWTMSEDRETLWADAFPTQIGASDGVDQYTILMTYDGLEPVAEADGDMAGAGANSKVRYGGIEVPIMFANFETNDLRYWSSTLGAN